MYYPMYDSTFILLIPAILLSLWAQFKVQGNFNKYSKVYSRSGITGAQVAKKLLELNGITDVAVAATQGSLTDHYHPTKKTVFLSETVYGESTISAIAVAAHECGHAIQHNVGYTPLTIRSMLVPVANIGSYASWILLIAGLAFSWDPLVQIGILLFSCVVLFQVVTLPVEFNASSRALQQLSYYGILANDEIQGGKKVLSAAAWTYVAAAVMAILQLLRLIMIFRRD
ncbi:MAG: zinc metallopeptidase [Bacillota bacterium]|jgi:Zn-dependent membrane protease YugP